ncbi:MAG: RNA polymerase sigma factor [Acetobacter sp.]|nr:RNA polymerase sigma factor [Bacteroides sp.]MCM1341060.1 RNA polymerase sigma factor [Acetobacter sp.]MCM1432384.1 RNA polymerase sigma factor [Clostridiales bacterium]
MDQKNLVNKAKNGDKDAFCALYNSHKDKLYRYAYYRLGKADDAEDAVSDTIVCAFERISTLRNANSFSSWIFKIHYSNCSKYIKSQIAQRETVNIADLENSNSFSQSISNDKTELSEALNQLKSDERELVLLAVVAGLNSKEIARITDLTSGSVRSKLSRSLAKMRNFLE